MAIGLRVLDHLADLPLIAALAWIAIEWGVTGHMQKRVFEASGKTVSRFEPRALGEIYRATVGDDANYRFHKRTRLVIPLLILAWVLSSTFARTVSAQ